MTAVGWAGVGAALLLLGAPAAMPYRIALLAGAGRLATSGDDRRSGRGTWRPGRGGLAAGAGLLALAVFLVAGPPLAIATGAAAAAAWRLVRSVGERRVADRRRAELRTAIGLLIGELDAGSRPVAALAAAAEAAPSYAPVFGAAARASDGASDAATALIAEPATAPLGHAWRLADETGVALSAVLGRVADDLAAADAQRRAVGVALSGPRSSAIVLAGLPLLGILLGVAMGAHPEQFLLDAPPGRWVCCAGVLLDLLGLAWLGAILRKAERA